MSRYLLLCGALMLAIVVVSAWPAQAQTDDCSAAEREMAYGEAAIQDAESQAGYLEAAKQYRAAITKAPDCAAAHFNLGVAYEKAGRLSSAKAAFETYLTLAPKAEDAAKVKKSIFKLEYRIKRAGQTESADGTREARRNSWAKLNGRYCILEFCEHPSWGSPEYDYIVSIMDSRITIRRSRPTTANLRHAESYTGTIDTSGSIRGRLSNTAFVLRGACAGQTFIENESSFTGTIRRGDLMDAKGRIVRDMAIILRSQVPAVTDFDYDRCRAVSREPSQSVLMLRKR